MVDRSKILPWAAGLGFLLMLPLFYVDWSEEGEYPRLEQAARVVRYMSAPRQLKRSSFNAIFPEGKPSDFVGWMFSEMGAAQWPPSDSEFMDPEERRALQALGMPFSPTDVQILQALSPQSARQVIVKADDVKGMIVVEGYLSPDQPPTIVRQWAFNWPATS